MKLWQKVFLCTFILFVCAFNAASVYYIKYSFSQNLQKEIERGLNEHFIIYSGFQINEVSINRKLGVPQSVVRDFLRATSDQYIQYLDNKEAFIEIRDGSNGIIYSNFKEIISEPRKELETLPSGRRNYIIRDVGEKSYLFITNNLELQDGIYKLTYIRDITSVYNYKLDQYRLFLKLNIITIAVLAVLLYLLLWYLTRSIGNLTKSAQTVSEGDYTQRVKILSNDELGTLAHSFNQMADAVEEKIKELKTTIEDKQLFIESFTHELKTPLTSIIGYADFLRSTRYNEDIFFNGLNYIYTEGKRLEGLSFKLMDLIMLKREVFDGRIEGIQIVCDEIAEGLKPRLESSDIQLIVNVENSKVIIDKDLFKALCINLLDNAIKASKKGSCIYLKGKTDRSTRYILEIEDEGMGIPKEDLPNVFEPFFMVDKARTRSQHGAGLGLAICAEIIKLHEAEVEIMSEVNQGTTVRIILTKVYN